MGTGRGSVGHPLLPPHVSADDDLGQDPQPSRMVFRWSDWLSTIRKNWRAYAEGFANPRPTKVAVIIQGHKASDIHSGGGNLDRGQRLPQFVAYHAQELGPQPLRRLQGRQALEATTKVSTSPSSERMAASSACTVSVMLSAWPGRPSSRRRDGPDLTVDSTIFEMQMGLLPPHCRSC